MPIISFHCTFGALTHEQVVTLLVWLFEIPPSNIQFDKQSRKVDVPATVTTKQAHQNCVKYGSYRFSAPKVISTPFGIVLRPFADVDHKLFTPDLTGYKMLQVMSGGHIVENDMDPETFVRTWSTGLGYRNTGIVEPITTTGKFKPVGDKAGIGYQENEQSYRKRKEPIVFVPESKIARSGDLEPGEIVDENELLHTLWKKAYS
jgi:hypothetical protein